MVAPSQQLQDTDWWTLAELAKRWKTSVATLKRMTKLPDGDPNQLKYMVVGKCHVRVHTSEMLRIEQRAKSVPPRQQEIIRKPVVKNAKITRLLDRRRAAFRQQSQEKQLAQQEETAGDE